MVVAAALHGPCVRANKGKATIGSALLAVVLGGEKSTWYTGAKW